MNIMLTVPMILSGRLPFSRVNTHAARQTLIDKAANTHVLGVTSENERRVTPSCTVPAGKIVGTNTLTKSAITNATNPFAEGHQDITSLLSPNDHIGQPKLFSRGRASAHPQPLRYPSVGWQSVENLAHSNPLPPWLLPGAANNQVRSAPAVLK